MDFRLVLFSLGVFLSACSTGLFVPAYNAKLDKAVTAAYTQVSEITACIDLGLCSTQDSFGAQQDNYIAAISYLKTAKIIAESITTTIETKTSSKNLLISFITGCQDQVIALGKLHNAGATQPGIGVTQSVDVACDQAMRATQAMK